jgi:hypothetical protein
MRHWTIGFVLQCQVWGSRGNGARLVHTSSHLESPSLPPIRFTMIQGMKGNGGRFNLNVFR